MLKSKIFRMIYIAGTLVIICSLFYFILTNPITTKYNKNLKIEVSTQNLRSHINFLCGLEPSRIYYNTDALNACADYAYNYFDSLNLTCTRQRYTDGVYPFQNIIAKYQPEKELRIILGAHYDVCGPFQGADDNASGFAGLLEIARIVALNKPLLDYGIDFVAYSTEEPPYFRTNLMGSAVHADSLLKNTVKIKLMVVLEMIGYYNSEPQSQTYPISALKYIYPTTADFIALVGRTNEFAEVRTFKKNMTLAGHIKVESINTPLVFEGIDFSDHRNYWSLNMKAIMVTNTSFFRNNNYHTENDIPETLDFDKMTEVVKGVYWALIHVK